MNAGIAVFVDFENLRRVGAHLFAPDFPAHEVTVCPSLVADLVASRRPTFTPVTSIVLVRGEPSRFRDPMAASRFRRDASRWSADPRIQSIFRPLHYGPKGWPKESGVDLRLGLDFVNAAKSGQYESVVLLSGDSDFEPALDDAARAGRQVEVAFWTDDKKMFNNPLAEYAIRQKSLWAHRLTENDFWNCVPKQRSAA